MLRPAALVAAAALVVAALVAAACSGGGGGDGARPQTGADLTRVAEADGVTVEATWLMPEDLPEVDADLSAYPLDEYALLEIDFTTHSGDLNEIDMERAAVLRRDEAEVQPADWISLSDDSHHRAGLLVFPRQPGGGPSQVTIDLGDENVSLVWQSVPNT